MFILASKYNIHSKELFSKLNNRTNEHWIFVKEKKYFDDLSEKICEEQQNNCLNIKKIFFFHWNYIVPNNIYSNIECINLHTSNLPDGKGGSPIQNQILENILITKVNALKMSDDGIDAGPIYCYQKITLQGNLFDIWYIISHVAYELISKIIDEKIKPKMQEAGNYITYKRRKNNIIPLEDMNSLKEIYDFIRMLDDDTYPDAYIKIGNFKLNFNRAKFNGQKIIADVNINID